VLRNDSFVLCLACDKNVNAFEFASARFRNDYFEVGYYITKNPFVFQFASTRLRDDKEFSL
jgi:hypothetical protein